MDIVKIVSIALSSLIVLILLRKINNDYALLAGSIINIFIMLFSLAILLPVFDYIKGLGVNQTYSDLCSIMFKASGISLLCTFASELCRDAGEGMLSSRIEFAGKCTLLAFCLPLIKKVFEYATTFID